jgi:hypothetical protein
MWYEAVKNAFSLNLRYDFCLTLTDEKKRDELLAPLRKGLIEQDLNEALNTFNGHKDLTGMALAKDALYAQVPGLEGHSDLVDSILDLTNYKKTE